MLYNFSICYSHLLVAAVLVRLVGDPLVLLIGILYQLCLHALYFDLSIHI
jgi:hypothetical protein